MTTSAEALPESRRVFRLFPEGEALRFELKNEGLPALAPNHVLVRIKAASLNYRDLLVARGQVKGVKEGLIPLSDGAGEVMATGQGTTRWRPGDRVAPIFYSAWHTGRFYTDYIASGLGAGTADGVLADVIAVHEDALVRLPDAYDFAEGATLPCAAVTAWQSLIVRGGLAEGDTLLVQGTGGVALFGLQIANAVGARTIVISSSDEKCRRAIEMGASATVNYRTVPEWDIEVRRLTDGLGASHILELVGPATFDRSLRALRAGGHIAQIGVITGFGVQSNLFRLQQINGTIDGINVGSREQFEAMNDFFCKHGIRPAIDRIFPMEETSAALEELANGMHFGKLVIGLN